MKMDAFQTSLIYQIRELQGKEFLELPPLDDAYFAKLDSRDKINKLFDLLSKSIDKLKAELYELKGKARKEENTKARVTSKLTHGDICFLDGEYFKVTESQRGYLYVTKWDGESWDYESGKGMLRKLSIANITTADQAAQFGHMYHRCVFCVRPLSRKESEDVGYGSDCAKQRGLPWG
jgi:hypothetical protein